MASPNGADAGARYRDRSRLEVADQPGAGASGAGGRTRPGRIDHLRRAAQPRHRTDAGRAADPGPARRRCGFGTDGQRPNRTGARRSGGLWLGGHGVAVCSAAGGAGLRPGHLRRRSASPGTAHRTAAGCAARARRRRRRRRSTVSGSRQRVARRRHRGHRRVGVLTVRVRAAAVRGIVHRWPDRPTHRFVAAVCAAHRDDGGDAAASRSRHRRLDTEPLAGAPRSGGGAALGHRTGPDQRGGFPVSGRGQRRHRAHHRLA